METLWKFIEVPRLRGTAYRWALGCRTWKSSDLEVKDTRYCLGSFTVAGTGRVFIDETMVSTEDPSWGSLGPFLSEKNLARLRTRYYLMVLGF